MRSNLKPSTVLKTLPEQRRNVILKDPSDPPGPTVVVPTPVSWRSAYDGKTTDRKGDNR